MVGSLENVLKQQVDCFEEINSGLKPNAFELFDGDGCLRVGFYDSRSPGRLYDVGYVASDFEYDSLEDLRIAVSYILTEKFFFSSSTEKN